MKSSRRSVYLNEQDIARLEQLGIKSLSGFVRQAIEDAYREQLKTGRVVLKGIKVNGK